jgi:hypothetical protein
VMDMGYQIETRLHNERRKRDWTEREDGLLLKMRQHGMSIVDITDALDRTQRSVETRLDRMKLRGTQTFGVVKHYQPVTSDQLFQRSAIEGSKALLKAILAYYQKYHGAAV